MALQDCRHREARSRRAPTPSDSLDPDALRDEQIAAELAQKQEADALRHGQTIVENGRLSSERDQWRAHAEATQQKLDALVNQLHVAAERQDFDVLAKEVQAKIEHGPEDFASRWLMTEAMNDPALRIAFDTRKESTDNVKALLFRAQDMLMRLQRDPRADPNQIAQTANFAQQCAIALDGPRIVAQAKARCVEAARKNPPVDPDLTLDRELVSQAVRGAGGKVPAAPAPNLGRMSEAEFRRHTAENYGF